MAEGVVGFGLVVGCGRAAGLKAIGDGEVVVTVTNLKSGMAEGGRGRTCGSCATTAPVVCDRSSTQLIMFLIAVSEHLRTLFREEVIPDTVLRVGSTTLEVFVGEDGRRGRDLA